MKETGQDDFNITPGQACTSKYQGIYKFYINQLLFFYQIFSQLKETLL